MQNDKNEDLQSSHKNEKSSYFKKKFASMSVNKRIINKIINEQQLTQNEPISRQESTKNVKIKEHFIIQQQRIQVTEHWKDACISKEIEEIEKLEKFIEEERQKASEIAEKLFKTQQEQEQRCKNLAQMKLKRQEDLKQKNIQKSSRAGNKIQKLISGDMEEYERRQEQIKLKEEEREAQRIEKLKIKEVQYKERLEKMEIKKQEYQKELQLIKDKKILEIQIREEKIKKAQEEKKMLKQLESLQKQEHMINKIKESSLKREINLKEQQDKIAEKLHISELKSQLLKQQRELKLEESKQQAKQQQQKIENLRLQKLENEKVKKDQLLKQNELLEQKLKHKQQEKQEMMLLKVAQEKEQEIKKKQEFDQKNLQREQSKQYLIQEKILKKELSVSKIKEEQKQIIMKKKLEEEQKREQKQQFIQLQEDQIQQMRLKSLNIIDQETLIFQKKQKEKTKIQLQVKLMREQLALKKQTMIDELKQLRKEFRMKNFDNQSFSQLTERNQQLQASPSNSKSRQSQMAKGHLQTYDARKQNIKLQKIHGSMYFDNDITRSDDDKFSKKENNKTQIGQYSIREGNTLKAVSSYKNILARKTSNSKSLLNFEAINDLQLDRNIINQEKFKRNKNILQTHMIEQKDKSKRQKLEDFLDQKTKIQNEKSKLVNEIDNVTNRKQRDTYKRVFNAYLTPSSFLYLQKIGVNKESVSQLQALKSRYKQRTNSPLLIKQKSQKNIDVYLDKEDINKLEKKIKKKKLYSSSGRSQQRKISKSPEKFQIIDLKININNKKKNSNPDINIIDSDLKQEQDQIKEIKIQ